MQGCTPTIKWWITFGSQTLIYNNQAWIKINSSKSGIRRWPWNIGNWVGRELTLQVRWLSGIHLTMDRWKNNTVWMLWPRKLLLKNHSLHTWHHRNFQAPFHTSNYNWGNFCAWKTFFSNSWLNEWKFLLPYIEDI